MKCIICGKDFYVKQSHFKIGWGKYCSKECQFHGQKTGKKVQCGYCGKTIYKSKRDIRRSKSGKNFCNKSCHCAWQNSNNRVGSLAPNWNGGEYIYRDLMKKNSIKPICSNCGVEDTRVIVVHHKDKNRKNNKIENLQWLCRNCHYIIHCCDV